MGEDKKPNTEFVGKCAGCGGAMTNINQSTTNPDYHEGCDPDKKED